ncbi:unnamed protein product [Cylicostephanus goldi]|uniref:Uncharacterized protein n=1 Tax=Cylicostephanus goldi TaxID=71465 RepID=A0A3P6SXP2_CYLGO|nr:unnamed protein product [Cylicostephanus goldi]
MFCPKFVQYTSHLTQLIIFLFSANRDEFKDERAPSAGGQSIEHPLRRKTSVLVPLMSREDLTQIPEMLAPPNRI